LRLVAFALVLSMSGVATPAPVPVPVPVAADVQRVDLAHGAWTRNGVEPEARPIVVEAGLRPPGTVNEPGEVPPAPHVVLPFDAAGVRWAHVFHTEEAAMMRLELEWRPGPEGALFEVVLDGQRLRPPRDGWRPTERGVRTDLGAIWLGAGGHLLEFVSREAADAAELRLCALRLEARGGD
jgi:hypothetical protein